MDQEKEALARRAETAIDALVNTAFERLRSERKKWDWASRSGWDQAKAAFDRIAGLQADYRRALEMFGWGHAATNGCLLGLVREAHGDESAYTTKSRETGMWGLHRYARGFWRTYADSTEDAALVAGLEAAP